KRRAAALEAQARKAAVPVAVSTDGVGRYPQELEAVAYFCSLEALQNIAKYANGARGARCAVAVSTDGVGRYRQELEAVAYFCSLEALQNIAKYANATRALI